MPTFRDSWSNKVLHLSSFISRKKDNLLVIHGFKAFISVLAIIGAEILLLIISLPSYLATRGTTDITNTKEYKLRRTLTLGTIATILIIWLIKLSLILFLVWHAQTYGSLKIQETSNSKGGTETIADDILIADNDQALLPPQITNIKDTHTSLEITGTAKSNEIIVFAFSNTAKKNSYPKLYSTTADQAGQFHLIEDENIFNLPPGQYSVSAITYDQARQTKSADSTTFNLTISQSFTTWFVHSLDILLNIIALLVILIGVMITILVG